MKNILITGKNSYIGESLKNWLKIDSGKYKIHTIDMKDDSWKTKNLSQYDIIFHVAAIVHRKEKKQMKELYFKVNRDLPFELAKKAKKSGVSQFIFMSTMAVYGEEGKVDKLVVINKKSLVNPKSLYGISKVEAESSIKKLNDENFKVIILRTPMVYGAKCQGNYSRLEKIALKSPIFPMVENKRSMVNIDKLCQLIKVYIDNEMEGLYFPQDDEYINTSIMVKQIANKNNKSIYLSKTCGVFIKLIGNRVSLINRIFGNLVYDKSM